MKPWVEPRRLTTGLLTGALLLFGATTMALAARPVGPLQTLDDRVLADSPEPFDSRIYGYDMEVDAQGNVHVVYSKPLATGSDQIVYARRVNGTWTQHAQSNHGLRSSISTELELDSAGNVHISYLRDDESLYYRYIAKGATSGTDVRVAIGAWSTRMQLDELGRPVFVRENENPSTRVSKLVYLETRNGRSWTSNDIALPQVPRFRIGDFVYHQGTYHITYGDSATTQTVLEGKDSTSRVPGVFHNVYYAKSANGTSWSVTPIDATGSLYENEFWKTLLVDDTGALGAFYRYAEVGDQYNTGTSLLVFQIGQQGLTLREITRADYDETREGMGVALAPSGDGQYLGAWDFSPDDTRDPYFRGERGNMALARSGSDGQWREKLQLAEFSAEGRVIMKVSANRIHVLVLGDFVDAKLHYRELDLDYVTGEFDKLTTGFPWATFLPAITR